MSIEFRFNQLIFFSFFLFCYYKFWTDYDLIYHYKIERREQKRVRNLSLVFSCNKFENPSNSVILILMKGKRKRRK